MDKRKRIEEAIKGNKVDRLPLTIYNSLLPLGESEITIRNRGLGIIYILPAVMAYNSKIQITEEVKYIYNREEKSKIVRKNFKTIYGDINIDHQIKNNNIKVDLGNFIPINEHSLEQTMYSCIKKFPFKNKKDYKLLEYFYKNIKYISANKKYDEIQNLLGSEGIVFFNVGKSPFQKMLYELMGPERCFFEYNDNKKDFLSLYNLLYEKQKEIYTIASESSALAIWADENITSTITSPFFFKKFCVPFYKEMAEILHKKNKIFLMHMDGLLKPIAELIREMKVDVIEGFTPQPMGDISVSEAKKLWPNKVIWINYPGSIIVKNCSKTVNDYTVNLIKNIASGGKFLLGFTENFPLNIFNDNFKSIINILSKK